jgi:4-hydroxy-tetrahydrodipicolinate synthase
MTDSVFTGCIPALMTPCDRAGTPDFQALSSKGRELIDTGMGAVVYCGSMGDWPLLSDEQRMQGVDALIAAGVPVVVGTGAQNTARATAISSHAKQAGAAGLMVIPRVLSRGISMVGFKEFGGAESLTYAAENITSGREDLTLMVGVDTQVVHGFVRCGAKGAITGVGNALPREILRLVELSINAAGGNQEAYRLACELDQALSVLSSFDEGPDLVLYYKHLMVLEGNPEYEHQLYATDALSPQQRAFLEQQWEQFRAWWSNWPGAVD